MKFLTILSLSTAALAAPSGNTKRNECTPISYRCHPVNQAPQGEGWDVCDAQGNWVWGGTCGPNLVCVFNPASKSPYCVPPPGPVCTNGVKRCSADGSGYQVCSGGSWGSTVTCAADEYCDAGECKQVLECVPGTYRCATNSAGEIGWEVCQVWGEWVWGGCCENGQTCWFNSLNGSPYCI